MFSNYKLKDEDLITDMSQHPRSICNLITSVASFLCVWALSPPFLLPGNLRDTLVVPYLNTSSL